MDNSADTFEHNEGSKRASLDYLNQALAAQQAGQGKLAIHLFLAAFDASLEEKPDEPCEQAIKGLKLAWALCLECKERTLAEYVFERLEPYLSSLEMGNYLDKLQDLALDKLHTMGFSREDLEEMSDAIMQGLEEMGITGVDGMRIQNISGPFPVPSLGDYLDNASGDAKQTDIPGLNIFGGVAAPSFGVPSAGIPGTAGSGVPQPSAMPAVPFSLFPGFPGVPDAPQEQASGKETMPRFPLMPLQPPKEEHIERFNYAKLYGYESAIEDMRSLGIGVSTDANLQAFIEQLNRHHGLSEVPRANTIIFRSPSREDADQFMEATFGELDVPGVRIAIEENAQGMPVLCVMAQKGQGLRLNAQKNEILGKGAVLLSNVDYLFELIPYGPQSQLDQQSLSRPAREALHLISAAVRNSDVVVLASCSMDFTVEPYMLDLLGEVTVVTIDLPNETERTSLWKELVNEYPSMKDVPVQELVQYSNNMPRVDICMAARDAVEQAYKASLSAREIRNVSKYDVFEQLAAYQALESEEYTKLEQALVDNFTQLLNSCTSLDELLGETSARLEPAPAQGEGADSPADEAVPAEKPKRARKPRAKKEKASEEGVAVEGTPESEPQADVIEQTPEKPKRTRKKKQLEASAECAEVASSEAADVAVVQACAEHGVAEPPAVEKPARRRRASKKKSEETDGLDS